MICLVHDDAGFAHGKALGCFWRNGVATVFRRLPQPAIARGFTRSCAKARAWWRRIAWGPVPAGGSSPGLGAKCPSRGYPRGEAPMKSGKMAREYIIGPAWPNGADCQACGGAGRPARAVTARSGGLLRFALDMRRRVPYLRDAEPFGCRRHRALHAGFGPLPSRPPGGGRAPLSRGSNGPCCPAIGPTGGYRIFSA